MALTLYCMFLSVPVIPRLAATMVPPLFLSLRAWAQHPSCRVTKGQHHIPLLKDLLPCQS